MEMTKYYANVNIFSAGASGKIFGFKSAFIEGNGNAASNDEESLRYMAKDLTGAVDKNNERIYKLIK